MFRGSCCQENPLVSKADGDSWCWEELQHTVGVGDSVQGPGILWLCNSVRCVTDHRTHRTSEICCLANGLVERVCSYFSHLDWGRWGNESTNSHYYCIPSTDKRKNSSYSTWVSPWTFYLTLEHRPEYNAYTKWKGGGSRYPCLQLTWFIYMW